MSDAPESSPPKRSALAQELADIRQSIHQTLEKRERVPQPMFWSVFSSRLEEIKRAKELHRIMEKAGGL